MVLIRAAVDHPVAQVLTEIPVILALEATELRLVVQALRVVQVLTVTPEMLVQRVRVQLMAAQVLRVMPVLLVSGQHRKCWYRRNPRWRGFSG